MLRSCQLACLWFLGIAISALASGCGSDPTHHDNLQQILSDTSLSEPEKLEQLARQIFNLAEFSLTPADPLGHEVTLSIRSNDDQVVRKIMENKDAAELNKALKEFHLKALNLQMADYLVRAQDMHLQDLTVILQVADDGSGTSPVSGDALYQLQLPQKHFAEFLTIAKLRPQESLPKAEKLWKVAVDQFR